MELMVTKAIPALPLDMAPLVVGALTGGVADGARGADGALGADGAMGADGAVEFASGGYSAPVTLMTDPSA